MNDAYCTCGKKKSEHYKFSVGQNGVEILFCDDSSFEEDETVDENGKEKPFAPLPCDECGGTKETGHQRLCPVEQSAFRDAFPDEDVE